VFVFECAVRQQCWRDCLYELVSSGVVMYLMVVGGGGCFKDEMSVVYRS